MQGSEAQVQAAAWLVARVISPSMALREQADKAAGRAATEFCGRLVQAGGLPPLLPLLLSRSQEKKAAGALPAAPLSLSLTASIQLQTNDSFGRLSIYSMMHLSGADRHS